MSFRRFSHRLAQSWASGGPARVAVRSVDSTNALARRVAAGYRAKSERPVAAVFLAWEQTRGRGRGDRRWESPPGAGVYCSLLLPERPSTHLAELPLAVALGLASALEPRVPGGVALRWPNDVMAGDRKLAGVLIESTTLPGQKVTAVVGFGVNYAGAPVPGATSILELDPLTCSGDIQTS